MPSARNRSTLLTRLGWSRRDAVAVAIGAVATVAILINVLLMQAGPHPAPMFNGNPAAAKPATVAAGANTPSVPRPRPAEAAPVTPVTAAPLAAVPVRTISLSAPATPPAQTAPAAPAMPPAAIAPPAAARTPGAIITDIQRELARRGFFDGAVDGFYGPRTDRAIREFERAAGLKPSQQPSEALLQAIQQAPGRIARGAPAATSARPQPVRNDAVAERPAPSRRVVALQRVLAEFGYGQIKPTGIVDPETRAAIERFERERKLPVTGQPTDRVVREIASVTGRSVE